LKPDESAEDDKSKKLQLLSGLLGTSYTQFGRKIMDSQNLDADCDEIIHILKDKGPSAIEIEINSLAPEGGGSKELMVKFLQLVLSVLKSRKNFEAIQAYLGLFLKRHSDVVLQSAEMIDVIGEIQAEEERNWNDLKGHLTSSSALVTFFKSSLVA
jgi:U3 small nucleolar RNA-associated protein 21